MWFKNICSHSDKCFEIQLVVIAHMKDVIIWSVFSRKSLKVICTIYRMSS